MLFNSINFAIFLPIVFILYWAISKKNLKYQNYLLFFSSYFFYGCWDWRFLFLLAFSTLLDYITGIKIFNSKTQQNKKIWFYLCITINLGFLLVFKYYNFFANSFLDLFSSFGISLNIWTLNIILPVGISFYTFHGLSYIIDIYNGKIKSEKNFIDYAVFVSFFPLLVAGPIERATHLLPQIKKKRVFNYSNAVDGLKQILYGLFKKLVIADNCSYYVNIIFNPSIEYSGSSNLLASILFSIQIYCDFSGYSDIAIGTARLFGIELIKNFNFPYFSRNIAEFWRRWHISLSTWFRDYLYIPLGGSKVNTLIKIRNTFIIFLVSGFWHGANWTFIIWGLLHAFFILPSILLHTNRNNLIIVAHGKKLPSINEIISIIFTFLLVTLAWIFFRSDNLSHAFNFIRNIFSTSLFSYPLEIYNTLIIYIILIIPIFICIEWIGRENNYAIQKIGLKSKRFIRWIFYFLIVISILFLNRYNNSFIYFQF